MMRIIYLYILCLGILSCSGKEKQEEVISIEEIIGETGEVGLDSIPTNTDTTDILLTDLSKFIATELVSYDTLSHDEFHSFDRFNYSSIKKIKFIGKEKVPYGKTNMVTPIAQLFYYTFSDTLKTKNAFYNWLDCFGADCNVVNLKEDVKSIKTSPMFTVVYDTTIIILEYQCEHAKNDWKSFQDTLIDKFGRNYKYIIDVDCGGPLKWK